MKYETFVTHTVAGLLAFVLLVSTASAEITLGVNDWPGFLAWQIAEKKGFFQKHNAAVKIVWYGSDLAKTLEDFAAGKLDANAQTWSDSLIHLSKGVPVKVILALDHSAGADALLVASHVRRLTDLKGKKVAVEQGSASQFLLVTALSKAALSEKDILPVYMTGGDAAEALIAGKVDAAATYNPFVNQVQAARKGRPIFSSKDMPGLIVDVVAVNEKSLKAKRADYAGMVRAWYDVESFMREHRDEAIGMMAAMVKQTPEKYRIFLSGVRFLNENDNLDAFAGSSNTRSLAKASAPILKFLSDAKLVQGQVDVSVALDGSLVQEAAKH
jgi:NitT/TauT family transport system substrate-binding protein